MSLSLLQLQEKKPWLDIELENLQVDGSTTITGNLTVNGNFITNGASIRKTRTLTAEETILTSADFGSIIYLNNSINTMGVILPAVSSCNGMTIKFFMADNASNSVQIICQSGTVILNACSNDGSDVVVNGGSTYITFVESHITTGDYVEISSDGVHFYAVGLCQLHTCLITS